MNERPLIIEFNEARIELTQSINNILQRGLPCYLIEPILAELLAQIKMGSQNELAQAKASEAARKAEVEA